MIFIAKMVKKKHLCKTSVLIFRTLKIIKWLHIFSHNMIPPINKTNRVTEDPATSIDQIITKTIADTQFKSGIIQADLSDDFPIFTNFYIYQLKKRECSWKT